jgi:hypothetical protein
VFQNYGIAAAVLCGEVFALGSNFTTTCFEPGSSVGEEHASFELSTRLLVCYFADECDADAQWALDAFTNNTEWVNAYNYGDAGQCRSLTQHTHVDVQNGLFVVPEATVSTNYTLRAADEEDDSVSLVNEAIKFWSPLVAVGLIVAFAVFCSPFSSLGRNRYSEVVDELSTDFEAEADEQESTRV